MPMSVSPLLHFQTTGVYAGVVFRIRLRLRAYLYLDSNAV